MISTIFTKRPRYYVSKNDYYETIITENTNLKNIATDLDFVKNEDFKTESTILFNNKLKLNSTYNDIIECFGTPIHQLDKSSANQHSVLFYKKRVGTYKIRLEIHVVDRKFLIGFITFNLSSKSEKSSIIDSISNKYQINITKKYLEDFRIFNHKNEFIKVIDSVDLTLVYGEYSASKNQIIKNIADEKELKYLSSDQKNKSLLHDNI
tara:strand:- start:410 stop:1033 length:624 start_codon:yes stop_codon:yes gene_type:complete